MRTAQAGGDVVAQQAWASHLLQIGNGEGAFAERYQVPADLCMPPGQRTVDHLIAHVFGDISKDAAARSVDALEHRAILCPLHKEVSKINDKIVALLPGTEKEYLSADSLEDDDDNEVPDDVFNSWEFSGFPSHKLVLKVGSIIILLRPKPSGLG